MTDQKIVELLVRAKLQGGRDLESITKSIRDLETAIESQAKAAQRGENTIGELRASLSALKAIQEELGKQAGFIRTYEKLGTTIESTSQKIADTQAEITKLNEAIGAQEKATKRQEDKQASLNKRLETQQNLLAQSIADQNLYAEALKRLGIETSQIADVQKRISDSTLASAVAYDRVNREIESYAINVRGTREAISAQAKAERDATRDADLFAAAESRAAKAAQERARAAEEVASLQSNRRGQVAADSRKDSEDAQAAKRAQELAALRADIEQRSAQAVRDAELFAAAEKRALDQAKARIKAAEEYDQRQLARINAIATETRTLREQEAIQKRQAELAALRADIEERSAKAIAINEARAKGNADRRAFDEEAQATKRAQELAALRADIEQRSANTQRDEGFRQQAADAEDAAKKFTSLARASTDLTAKFPSVRDAIRDILDPSRTVAANLATVESTIKKVADTVAAATGPIQDYKDQFKNLEAAQRGIANQASLVDQFKNQTAALKAAEDEFNKARFKVSAYAAELRKGGEGAQQFIKPLADAEARLKRAAEAMRDQGAAVREVESLLRAAGINTAQLATEEQRLVAAAQAATKATKDLGDAVERAGKNAGDGAKGFSLFRDEGRTTLSLAQRLRGEVLALGASYLGLQGAISLAGSAIEKFNEREATKTQLSLVTDGNKAEADKEYQYIRAQADRIGVVQDDAAKNYAKFAVAAKLSGKVSRDEAKYIFEAFTEVSKVMKNTPDEMKGVFTALQQIVSKGKIQAEELRGQLGERLPGIFEVAQKAVKDTFPDLNKALEEGKVSSAFLLKIAEEYRKSIQGQLPAATQDLTSQQNRLTNAVNDFKRAIADGGFADSYAKLLGELADFLKSQDGADLAKSIASAFKSIADALVTVIKFTVEYRTELLTIAEVFIALKAVQWTSGLVAQAGVAIAALRATGTAVTKLQMAFAGLGAFIVGWEIGTYIYEKFAVVRKAGAVLVGSFLLAWNELSFGFQMAMAGLPEYAENAMIGVVNFIIRGAKAALGAIKKLGDALGIDSSLIDKAMAALVERNDREMNYRVVALRKEREAEAKKIRDITKQMIEDADKGFASSSAGAGRGKVNPAGAKSPGDPTDFPGFTNPKMPPSESEISKRANAIQAIENALDQLEARIDRAQTETLQKQLDAIDKSVEPLQEKIKKLGGNEAATFKKRLDELVAEQKLITTRKFNQKLIDEQEALTKKIEAAEAAAGRKNKIDVEARLEAVRKSYEGTYREIEEMRKKLAANGMSVEPANLAKQRLDTAVTEQVNLERQKALKDQIVNAEGNVNAAVQERAAKIQAIADLQAAGAISQQEAEERQKAAIDEMQPKIELLAHYAITLAESMRDAFEDQTALDAMIAKMEKARTSGSGLKKELDQTGQIISRGIGAGVDKTFDAMIDKIKQVAEGTADWGDVFDEVGKSILRTVADIILEIGKAIIKQQIMLALKSVGVPVAHSGAVIGSVASRSRSVEPGIFAAAPRYHTGGVVGLAPDEYPAILQKNEEVLSKSDPRNVLNGGLSAGKDNGGSKGQRFVLVDDRSKVAEAMASAEGEDVIMQHVYRNIPSLRQRLK